MSQQPWFMRGVKSTEVDPEDLGEPTDEGVSTDRRIDEFVGGEEQQLSEVEMRLEKARYYRLLVDTPLFTDDTVAGNAVLDEIREFVRYRMNVLVGIEQEKQVVSDVFDPEEIAALKQVAARLLGRTGVQPVAAPAAPGVRPVAVAPAPAVRPVTPPASARPAAKPAAPAAPAKPEKKPRQPRAKKSEAAPAPAAKPEPKPESAPAGSTPTDEPIHLKRAKSIEEVDIEQFAWEQKVIVGNKMWKVQDDGSGNRTWRDITPVAKPTGANPIPMPTPEMAEMHQTAQAHEITRGADRAMAAGRAVGTNDTITHEP